ncbi:molybdenum ABC transporter ATP-binding protein [Algiphilus sp.]|uniref:molybdenum ABC transporter ATP-binding protein n=1 Tax=Algiphilus sp. TaxID=1872431 RepID=UPI0025BED21B|nr:molybdenum ABC transporter ATP-binding protein [Algiphilus sp.]MCK5770979.1 molybdenum ABC transporter ATP-binding protein [Algiphilus sp.]
MLQVEIDQRQGAFRLRAEFAVEHGVTALFGPSGAGKTTTLDVIAGLRRLQHGRIVAGGRTLVDTARGIVVPGHQRHIGYVFQEPRLFPHRSVRANLRYGMRRHGQRRAPATFDQMVDLLDLGHLLVRRPAGLSGGEARRVAIGRALLAAPSMLLLDEPLVSLDDARRAELLPFIELLRDRLRIPMVYVSHRVDEVRRLADTVIRMAEGRIEQIGPPSEVLPGPIARAPAGVRAEPARDPSAHR